MKRDKKLHIVIVEDELELRDNIIIILASKGFDVRGVSDGTALDEVLATQPVDIVILDLGLPGEDGLKIAERLRNNSKIGVIMLTARGMKQDRILGLDSGADNYFVKPVDIDELAAAINSLGRRIARPPVITSWHLNVEASCLHTPNGISIQLTAKECLLLQLMFKHLGENVSRTDVFQAIGEPPDDNYSNPRLEVLISRLRSKALRFDPASPLPLRARHNIGYIFLAKEKL